MEQILVQIIIEIKLNYKTLFKIHLNYAKFQL